MMPELVSVVSVEEPGSLLRAARLERGWDVPQLVMRLRQAAFERGWELPSNKELRLRVRGWEGGQPPKSRYLELLTAVYGVSREELGLPVPRDAKPEIDNERWARVIARYRPWVLRRFTVKLADAETAEDLTQDLFIQLGRSLHKVDPATDGHLYPYLNLQVRWTLNSYFAEQAKRNREFLAPSSEGSADVVPIEPAATDELSQTEALGCHLADVRALLAPLKEKQRQVLALRVVDDLTSGQIAVRLGVSVGTVDSRMQAALAAVRRNLGMAPPAAKKKQVGGDGTWAVAARAAVAAEAATGRLFTSADLIERYQLEAPDTPQKWNHVLTSLTRAGVIAQAGWSGPRDRRRRAYLGTNPTPAPSGVASAHAAVA
ncbi:RNA polymerase sigma factor [Streptomyces sp. NBRC 109706]|uniref:RNA polymerase sigma factor n=1 Tax=Streptomyces sp. NBRC 109706 TaxID=1550035 RepID=UPI000782388D|nr:sigma-70 family RNA polymerase sigma factor [Streptomyces sp. NBRC 109706]